MAILNSNLYVLLFTASFLILSVILYFNNKNFIYIFLFIIPSIALYFLCTYYLLPMPLNLEGLYSVFNPKTPIMLIPFESGVTYAKNNGIIQYLLYLTPLISAAILIGFSIPLLVKGKHHMISILYGFCFQLIFILLQFIFRITTGYEGKPIDITDAIIFILFQSFGFFLCSFILKLYPDFKRMFTHQGRTEKNAETKIQLTFVMIIDYQYIID